MSRTKKPDPYHEERQALVAAAEEHTLAALAAAIGVHRRTLERFIGGLGASRQTVGAIRRMMRGQVVVRKNATVGSNAHWSPNPALRNTLPGRAYDVALGYLQRLERATVPVEQIEEAERLLLDGRYAKLNKRGRGELTEDEHIQLLEATWAIIAEVLAWKGVRP